MRKLLLGLAVGGLLVLSCNNPGDKIGASPDSTGMQTDSAGTGSEPGSGRDAGLGLKPGGADTAIAGCYIYQRNRDTISITLEMKGCNVAGPVSYNFYQKDRNDGTFQGEVANGMITGWYLFKSEGVMSVRQEVWKISNGRIIPGMGEHIERADSSYFKDASKLRFDSSMALMKIPCVI